MMEQVLDVPSQDVITKDNAVVKVDGVVFFQVLDAAKAAYEVAQPRAGDHRNLVMTNIRTAIGSMDLDESLSKRDEINAKVLCVVDAGDPSLGHQGQPHRAEGHPAAARPGRFDGAADEGRAREARQHPGSRRLRARPRSCAPKARSSPRSCEAEGKREAAFREAEARERLAEAEAKATQMVSEAIAGGNVQAINYFVAQKYIEAFKALAEAPNQKFVLMPMESAGVIGSLGGIAELAKEALDRQASGKTAAGQPRSGRLSMRCGLASRDLGGGRAAAVRGRNAGAGRLHAVAGLRGRRRCSWSCCCSGSAGRWCRSRCSSS